MSSENTTIIDRIYETFETRDFATFFNLMSPDIHITQCPEVSWGVSSMDLRRQLCQPSCPPGVKTAGSVCKDIRRRHVLPNLPTG